MSDADDLARLIESDLALLPVTKDCLTDDGWNWLMAQNPGDKLNGSHRLLMQQLHHAGEAMIDHGRSLARLSTELGDPPEPRTHRRYVATTKLFFAAWYETMERAMAYLAANKGAYGADAPPVRSVERFLDWCQRNPDLPEWAIVVLREARAFRALVTHAAELPVHDWMTWSAGEGEAGLRLFGFGPTPHNAIDSHWEGFPGDWHAPAPDSFLVAMAVARILYASLPRVTGWVLRDAY